MGLFEIQRQLAAESGATTVRAEAASADHDRTGLAGFLADAWHNVRDPRYVARLYNARARTDRAVALALARASQKRARRAARPRGRTAPSSPRSSPRACSPTTRTGPPSSSSRSATRNPSRPRKPCWPPPDDDDLRLALADVIATWADDKTCAALADPARLQPARRDPGPPRPPRRAGRTGHRAAQLPQRVAQTRRRRVDRRVRDLVTAIGAARVADGAPLLLASLVTPLICHALHALAELAARQGPRARPRRPPRARRHPARAPVGLPPGRRALPVGPRRAATPRHRPRGPRLRLPAPLRLPQAARGPAAARRRPRRARRPRQRRRPRAGRPPPHRAVPRPPPARRRRNN
jgi:hypothetical protein